MIHSPYQYYSNDQIMNSVMGGKCKIYVERKGARVVWWRIPKKRDHFEDLGMETRMMLKSTHKKQDVGLGVD